MQQNENFAKQAEQAEAERPEVVAYFDRNYPSTGDAFIWSNYEGSPYEPVMTVAQHERIVVAEKGKTAAAMLESHRQFVRQFEEGTAELIAQRDAALARVAELERGKVYVEARQCDECQHGGINDSATGVAACHECDWTGPEPEEDKCPGCQRENCMAAACPQCGARYVLVASEEIAAPVAQAQQLHDLDKQCRDDVARALGLRPSHERGFAWSYLLASIKSCVKASEDAAQAQHSVPEGWKLVPEDATLEMVEALKAELVTTSKGGILRAGIALNAAIAAAPGKEVPQAWHDVQAERRRQVEAEGWTPEHDDAHSHGEMARAAACYALAGSSAPNDGTAALLVSLAWPWDEQWWKPSTARRDMVKACALALAEIERLDRAGISQNPQPGATTASS
ncbi:hypothetical protein [Pseudomonas aeruginosa]|uniref:hypothetical protein n=1 Tax=Pseudomonas aeruginosa TaxID=287 RepID=UPI0022EBE1E9|nr:hypothetical protein [Pseudomonas aeruginosa]